MGLSRPKWQAVLSLIALKAAASQQVTGLNCDDDSCIPIFGECAGSNSSGRCCDDAFCVVKHFDFAQCLTERWAAIKVAEGWDGTVLDCEEMPMDVLGSPNPGVAPEPASDDGLNCDIDECASKFEQCGGENSTSILCCDPDADCVIKNWYYAQCLPKKLAAQNVAMEGWDGRLLSCEDMPDDAPKGPAFWPLQHPSSGNATVVPQSFQYPPSPRPPRSRRPPPPPPASTLTSKPPRTPSSPPASSIPSPAKDFTFKGDLTYYGGAGVAGHCTHSYVPEGFTTVALNAPQYALGAACGTCIYACFNDVRLGKGERCMNAIVDDECPECLSGDLDLGETGDGRWPVKWRIIQCPTKSGGLKFSTQGSNPWYAKVKVQGGPSSVSSMICNGLKGKMTADAFFEFNSGSGGFKCGMDCTVAFNNGFGNGVGRVEPSALGNLCK